MTNSLRPMALHLLAVGALLMVPACQSATVHGSDGQDLTVTMPRSVAIHRGEVATLEIAIDRSMFSDTVTVSIGQLPAGVTAEHSSMAVETTQATFSLFAAPSAPLVRNHAVFVTVADPDGRKVLQSLELTVSE